MSNCLRPSHTAPTGQNPESKESATDVVTSDHNRHLLLMDLAVNMLSVVLFFVYITFAKFEFRLWHLAVSCIESVILCYASAQCVQVFPLSMLPAIYFNITCVSFDLPENTTLWLIACFALAIPKTCWLLSSWLTCAPLHENFDSDGAPTYMFTVYIIMVFENWFLCASRLKVEFNFQAYDIFIQTGNNSSMTSHHVCVVAMGVFFMTLMTIWLLYQFNGGDRIYMMPVLEKLLCQCVASACSIKTTRWSVMQSFVYPMPAPRGIQHRIDFFGSQKKATASNGEAAHPPDGQAPSSSARSFDKTIDEMRPDRLGKTDATSHGTL